MLSGNDTTLRVECKNIEVVSVCQQSSAVEPHTRPRSSNDQLLC